MSNCVRQERSALGGVAADQRPQPVVRPVARRILNAESSVELRGYQVRLVGEAGQLRDEVDLLVAGRYSSRGLGTSGEAHADSGSEKVTIAAALDLKVVGTLTLRIDSLSGLFSDLLYPRETNILRASGGRLCEVTRLALDPQSASLEVLGALFNVAFILAREVFARTDLLAEVHPRHTGFYRRTMGYRVLGPKRLCLRVNAPAILMHLRLGFAADLVREFAGSEARHDRNLYRLFAPPPEQHAILQKLTVPGAGGQR
ncbi:MAG: long-chain N-acyl amino acid synthase [Gammaproteobacteria bacterium]